jgi:catechol 2,3-dioxygenase-like lactoylglutathione lyase family enzyme
MMFKDAFSSFSVDDTRAARQFYGETLGLDLAPETEGLSIHLPGGGKLFIYPKDNHEPATFTVLNLMVDDIDAAVVDLRARGIGFESYTGQIETDEQNIFRGSKHGHGPDIAWFKDPAGNVISVTQVK